MSLVKFITEWLRPDLCPGIDRWTLAIVVLVEPVLSAIGVEYLKAVECVNDLVPFYLLGIAKDHAKRVIGVSIVSVDLLHGKGVTDWSVRKGFLQNNCDTTVSEVGHMVGPTLKHVDLIATGRNRKITDIRTQRI